MLHRPSIYNACSFFMPSEFKIKAEVDRFHKRVWLCAVVIPALYGHGLFRVNAGWQVIPGQQVISVNVKTRVADAYSSQNAGREGITYFQVLKAHIARIPYPVVGVSLASQPLHAVLGAVGIGFSTAALYIGSMAITSDVNGGTVRHYKLAFGLNLPVRTIMGKLGINTQIGSGGS